MNRFLMKIRLWVSNELSQNRLDTTMKTGSEQSSAMIVLNTYSRTCNKQMNKLHWKVAVHLYFTCFSYLNQVAMLWDGEKISAPPAFRCFYFAASHFFFLYLVIAKAVCSQKRASGFHNWLQGMRPKRFCSSSSTNYDRCAILFFCLSDILSGLLPSFFV